MSSANKRVRDNRDEVKDNPLYRAQRQPCWTGDNILQGKALNNFT